MSANASTLRETGGVVVLPPMGQLSPDQQMNASMTRWVWNPYRTIYNTGLQGGPPSPLRHFGFRGSHRYAEFERCNFYPLGNISWEEVDREALAEQSLAGLGAPSVIPQKTFTKYAYDQAAELQESYGNSYGLRVLQPAIVSDLGWVDDHALVSQVALVVQPTPFKLKDMEAEFTTGAKGRIAKANLSPAGRALAAAFLKAMLQGGRVAKIEAEREYRELIREMGNASVGKPGISTPNEFHVWLCDQLGVDVPETVHATKRTDGDDTLKQAVTLLTQKALKEDGLTDELKQKLAESEARSKAMEDRLDAIESRRKPGPKPREE